ncbi:MAG: magnesium transporter CorA family protein [Candidatus Latescibacteria bacterium]|jgi:magnesium transporter|nr:magnesium transporter CorA family protein [Candidatus Latescibacterota bacterium]
MIRIFSYSHSSTRMETPGIAELPGHLSDPDRMVWVDLEAPNDEEVGVLGGIFGFHVLAAEDCIRGDYLPKVDLYDTYTFLVLHAVDLETLAEGVETIEVGIFIGERFLVTHHARQVKGIFDARGKVAQNPGSLLKSPDWLLHGIVDAMVDHYQQALDRFDERISEMELLSGNGDDLARDVLLLRTELLRLKRVGALQERITAQMADGDIAWISEGNRIYFRNVYDHMVRAVQELAFLADRLLAVVSVWTARASTQNARSAHLAALMVTFLTPLVLIVLLFDVKLRGLMSDPVGLVVGLVFFILTAGGVAGVLKWKRWF